MANCGNIFDCNEQLPKRPLKPIFWSTISIMTFTFNFKFGAKKAWDIASPPSLSPILTISAWMDVSWDGPLGTGYPSAFVDWMVWLLDGQHRYLKRPGLKRLPTTPWDQ